MVDCKLALLWLGDFSLILTFSRWEKGCNPSPLVYAVPLLEIVRAYVRMCVCAFSREAKVITQRDPPVKYGPANGCQTVWSIGLG